MHIMYNEYFGLKENPFSIAPDPHYFFMSEGHREALAHLVYGINSDGAFILLTGEVGTGKTTVCRCLLEQMPDNTDLAFILNPKVTVNELLASICDEFYISYPEGNNSNKVFISAINDYLLKSHAKGRRGIIIIEEAQNLSVEVLEQIRLLTNLETNQSKLLQIVMLGQPELRDMLAKPELRQLAQRITARYHLGPLSKEEVGAYVNHRLRVAGLVRGQLFPETTIQRLYRMTGGVPRLINLICDRALIGAYVQGEECVNIGTLVTASHEVFGKEYIPWWKKRIFQGALVGLFILFCVVFVFALNRSDKSRVHKTPEVASASVSETTGSNATNTVNTVKPLQKKDKGQPSEHLLTDLKKPVNITGVVSKDKAFMALADVWQIFVDTTSREPVCDQVKDRGLRCLESQGILADLQQTNKPAVLEFLDSEGVKYYAALVKFDGQIATVRIGDELRVINKEKLVERWTGVYTIFWRLPAAFSGDLKPGSQGSAVAWLNRQLALVKKQAFQPDRKPVYDTEMENEIKAFQTEAGLTIDGIVGTKTLICLTDAAGTGGPSLGERRKRSN